MEQNDIRWKQRFQNYVKAFHFLEAAVSIPNPDIIQRAGVTQGFEFTFELAWKTLKDYLESNDVEVKYPRDTIKQAFQYELIKNGDAWMDMLEKRNLMSHTYDETNAELAYRLICDSYFPVLNQFYQDFLKLSNE